MSPSTGNVILMVSKAPSLRYFAFLSSLFREKTGLQPVFWAADEQLADMRALGVAAGWTIDFSTCGTKPLSDPGVETGSDATPRGGGAKAAASSRARSFVTSRSGSLARTVAFNVLRILRFRGKSARIIRNVRPVSVYVWGDNGGLGSGDFLRLCNEAGIRVVHCPVALSQQEIIAELRITRPEFFASGGDSAPLARAVGRRFPAQTIEHKNRLLLYHTLDEILAMLATGCLTPRPWVLGMSRADEVMLATDWERDYWVGKGLAREKISVVGFYELDDIKREGPSAAGDQDSRPTIVYSPPNFAEHGIHPWDTHWEIIRSHLRAISRTGCRVLLALHPKSAVSKYEWLEGEFGCTIFHGGTARALLSCSLYVTIGSTTALWAACMGVRVLDLGRAYGYEVPLFRGVPRITLVGSDGEFEELIAGAYRNGQPLRDADWYIDRAARAEFLAGPLAADAVLRVVAAPRGFETN